MFINRYWTIVLVCGTFLSSSSSAFDPFTVAAVVGTTASVVSSLSETTSEVAASADAFSELYSEIDSGAEMSQDGQKLVQEIYEIESLAKEAGYTKEELDELTADSVNSLDIQILSTTLKKISKAVRAGKRVARLLMKLDQRAKISEVESAQIEREQLVVLYKQLRLENQRSLNELKEKLKEQKEKRDQISALKREEKKKGAMIFGKTGVLSFPKQEGVVEEALQVAIKFRPTLLSLLLFVFLLRAVFYQIGFFGSAKYGDLIRDAILCSFMMMVFPDLVRACISICHEVAAAVGLKDMREVDPGKLEFPTGIGLTFKSRLMLEWALEWIKYLAFSAAQFLANFGLAFLILLFPIVIFCSQMLNFSIAWPVFIAGFLSICLWPFFWNATGMLAVLLWRKDGSSISDQLSTLLFSILQFLSPLIGVACLKGQPLSKSIQSASNTVSGALRGVTQQVAGFVVGAKGSSGGGQAGRVLSYPLNQGVGRMMAAGRRGREAFNQSETSSTILKQVAAGFVTSLGRAPTEPSFPKTAIQVAKGFKRQPIYFQKAHKKGDENVQNT